MPRLWQSQTPRAIYRLAHLDLTVEKEVEAPIDPDHIAGVMRDWGICKSAQERFWVMAYDGARNLRTLVEIARGGFDTVSVPVEAVLAAVLTAGANRFIVIHNHPTNDVRPTEADMDLTSLIRDAGALVGVYLEDHIIVGPGQAFFSMADHGVYKPDVALLRDSDRRRVAGE